jgi:CheY-like chemotaxis protein
VEDNELNQELAQELLADAGIELTKLSDGQQAVDLLSQGAPFDAVLMDCQMPELDGYAATRRIREFLPDLPIIAMTAHASTEEMDNILACGMNDRITKPIDVQRMFETLARWVRVPAERTAAQLSGNKPTAPRVDQLLNRLQHSPLIDTQAGLKVAMHKPQLYERLLHKFVISYEGFAQQWALCVDQQQLNVVLRLTHTLKGSAANIGAKPLAERAGKLEDFLKSAPGLIGFEALADQMLAGLKELLDELRTTDTLASSVSPAGAGLELLPKVQRLIELVYTSDMIATEFVHELKNASAASPHELLVAEVAQHLEQFDFESAGSALQTLLQHVRNHP